MPHGYQTRVRFARRCFREIYGYAESASSEFQVAVEIHRSTHSLALGHRLWRKHRQTLVGAVQWGMRLSHLTCIVWCANSLLDEGGDPPFTVAELEKEGRAGRLLELILRMDDKAGTIAFAVQTEESRRWVESALGDAFSALDSRFSRKAGVDRNPLCLVVAITVEAIQQQFAGSKATR